MFDKLCMFVSCDTSTLESKTLILLFVKNHTEENLTVDLK